MELTRSNRFISVVWHISYQIKIRNFAYTI